VAGRASLFICFLLKEKPSGNRPPDIPFQIIPRKKTFAKTQEINEFI
jgi:hypothetical protein